MLAIKTPILITGATGFVGANLLKRLVAMGLPVAIIIRKKSDTWRINDIISQVNIFYADLTEAEAVKKAIKAIKPRTIFHLAAYGAYPFQKDPEKIYQTNLLSTLNLMQACSESGFDIFINTGSSSEYGTKNQPMAETDLLEPNSHYAIAKASQTLLCEHYSREKNLPIVTLRLFSVYGPYEEPTRLIPTLVINCLRGQDLSLASPATARDFIYIDDVINIYLQAAQNQNIAGQIINVGTGKQGTLNQVVDRVVELTQARVAKQWGTDAGRPFDTNIWVANNKKLSALLNYQPRFNLSEGLFATVEWFKVNLKLYQK